jgi:hypothetical protein
VAAATEKTKRRSFERRFASLLPEAGFFLALRHYNTADYSTTALQHYDNKP